MKKIFRPQILVALTVALVLCFAWFAFARAQGGLTYSSGIQVVNNGTAKANIILTFYNPNGTSLVFTDTIALNSSNTYFDTSMPGGLPANFKGSLVISSDQPVSAIANLTGTLGGYYFGASTTSFDAGATTFSLPLIMCNNGSFNTFYNVQNAGTTDAHITVNYTPGTAGVPASETATIKPGASASFDQATGSSTANCAGNVGLGIPKLADTTGKFVGSAKITSDVPVVATVMQLNNSTFKILMGYNGFADGSTSVNFPLIMSMNYQLYTGFMIQNTGVQSTTVTVTYSSNTVANKSFTPAPDIFVLQPGQAVNRIQYYMPGSSDPQYNAKWNQRYIGGATVTNSTGQKLVAIVNQVLPKSGGAGWGSAYEGFDPTKATSKISAPLIMANNYKWYTGIQIQNASGTTCPSISINYSTNTASSYQPTNESITNLGGGASITIIQNGLPPDNGSVNDFTPTQSDPKRYIGSAEISATGCQILAIINEASYTPTSTTGDYFFTYDGFNH